LEYRRVIIPHPGDPSVLQVIEESIPEPQPGEVRVKVHAAGVARADVMMRMGQYPGGTPPYPYTPGYDIVGEVDQLGEGTSTFEIGEKVAALTEIGGYAEYVCLSEDSLVPVAPDIDSAEAVCLVLNHLTAYQMLHRFAKVRMGERALFHAAASGVGTALLQLGSLMELEMFGTASSGKHNVVSQLGGTPIDYQMDDFVKQIRNSSQGEVDVVCDPVGGSHLWRSFRALNNKGRLIAYGEMAITGPKKPKKFEKTLHHYLPNLLNRVPGDRIVQWYEVFLEYEAHPDWYQEDMATLFGLLAEKKINPIVAECIPLTEAARAHELLESSAVCGKLVLMCQE
jgi:NADPH2:quinone reductase